MTNHLPFEDPTSLPALAALLHKTGEDDRWDHKETLGDITDNSVRAELVKDILAFANTEGGGHLILGVQDRAYEPIGLPNDFKLDATEISKALTRYTKAYVHVSTGLHWFDSSDVPRATWEGRRLFGTIYVHPHPSIAVTSCSAAFNDPSTGKQKVVFAEGAILVRRGAQSVLADQPAVDALIRQRAGIKEDQKPLPHNLPPREEIAPRFIGRAKEINSLWQWFLDPDARRWLLAGSGGKGKSAIAYEFAAKVKALAPGSIKRVLWLSAKRERFGEEGVEVIEQPDFWDLPSLLDAILTGYNYGEAIALPLHEKQQWVLDLLNEQPALFVVDDLDSLDEHDPLQVQAIAFLWERIGGTVSKILFTSRESTGSTFFTAITHVSGLEPSDAALFVQSRVAMYELDQASFPPAVVQDILSATDRSPLYMQALLWLCTAEGPREAIKTWRRERGEVARRYSLERQIEKLPQEAKKVLFACCVAKGPISLVEIQEVTGCGEQATSLVQRIQRLYLMSLPRLIEQDHRFDVDVNTRALVLDVFKGSDILREVITQYNRVTGQHDVRASKDMGSFIRQAQAYVRADRADDAEKLLLAALDKHPDDPDLLGYLGVVYRKQERFTAARMRFKRARELHCRREWLYGNWADMEARLDEYTAALQAAESGLEMVGHTVELCYLAGNARSRLALEPLKTLDYARAFQEFSRADNLLRTAYAQIADQPPRPYERYRRSSVYRALVLNTDRLISCGRRLQRKDYVPLIDDLFDFLDAWVRDCPSDERADSERARLLKEYQRPARSDRFR